jgi:hypothetical protein
MAKKERPFLDTRAFSIYGWNTGLPATYRNLGEPNRISSSFSDVAEYRLGKVLFGCADYTEAALLAKIKDTRPSYRPKHSGVLFDGADVIELLRRRSAAILRRVEYLTEDDLEFAISELHGANSIVLRNNQMRLLRHNIFLQRFARCQRFLENDDYYTAAQDAYDILKDSDSNFESEYFTSGSLTPNHDIELITQAYEECFAYFDRDWNNGYNKPDSKVERIKAAKQQTRYVYVALDSLRKFRSSQWLPLSHDVFDLCLINVIEEGQKTLKSKQEQKRFCDNFNFIPDELGEVLKALQLRVFENTQMDKAKYVKFSRKVTRFDFPVIYLLDSLEQRAYSTCNFKRVFQASILRAFLGTTFGPDGEFSYPDYVGVRKHLQKVKLEEDTQNSCIFTFRNGGIIVKSPFERIIDDSVIDLSKIKYPEVAAALKHFASESGQEELKRLLARLPELTAGQAREAEALPSTRMSTSRNALRYMGTSRASTGVANPLRL